MSKYFRWDQFPLRDQMLDLVLVCVKSGSKNLPSKIEPRLFSGPPEKMSR